MVISPLYPAFYLKKYPKNRLSDSEIESLKAQTPFFFHL